MACWPHHDQQRAATDAAAHSAHWGPQKQPTNITSELKPWVVPPREICACTPKPASATQPESQTRGGALEAMLLAHDIP